MRNGPVRKVKNSPGNEQEDLILHKLVRKKLNISGRTKTSSVWNFFHIDSRSVCRATCSICKKSMGRGKLSCRLSNSSLLRHLKIKHSTQWALACQGDGVEVGEISDQLGSNDQSELCNSRIGSLLSKPSVLSHLEGNSVTDQDQLLLSASEPPEITNGHLGSPEPSLSFLTCLEEDPGTSKMVNIRGCTKTSAVWNFFHIDPKSVCRATCNICKMSMSRGTLSRNLSNSSLVRHLERKHSTQWALACRGDGVEVGEISDQLFSNDQLDLCSSRIGSLLSEPSVISHLGGNGVTDQDQLLLSASEPPEITNSYFGPPEPSLSVLACLGEEPGNGYNNSALKKKCKHEPSRREKIQSNEIAFQGVQPVSNFPSSLGPGEERCALGHGSSLESVLTPHKRPKRSKSLIWNFFLVDPQSPSKATCAVCNKSMSRGRPGNSLDTTALQWHLETKHPVQWSMARESSNESEMLDYTLTFSLASMSAEVENADNGEEMLAESTTETSIPQCFNKLQEEQCTLTNENIAHELNLLTCDGRYAHSVGDLHEKCKHSADHLKEKSILLSNCVDKTNILTGTSVRKQKHNTGKNCKMELTLLSSCTDKREVYDDKLYRENGQWKHDTPKPVTALLDGANGKEDCVGMSLGKIRLKVEPGSLPTSQLLEQEQWENDPPKTLTVLSDSANGKEVCVGLLLRKNSQKVEPASWSTRAQLEVKHPEQKDMVNKDGQQDEAQKAKHPTRLRKTLILSDNRSGTFRQSSHTGISGASQAGDQPRRQVGTMIRQEVEQKIRPKKACHRVTPKLKRSLKAKNLVKVLESHHTANHNAIPKVVDSIGNNKDDANSSSNPISCKRKKQRKSLVWTLFNPHPSLPSHVICIMCKRSITLGRPGTPLGEIVLQRHLVAMHALQWYRVAKNRQCSNA